MQMPDLINLFSKCYEAGDKFKVTLDCGGRIKSGFVQYTGRCIDVPVNNLEYMTVPEMIPTSGDFTDGEVCMVLTEVKMVADPVPE